MKPRLFFLIQLLLWLAVFFWSLPDAAQAASPQEQLKSVQALEDTVLAVRYDQEPMDSRLTRLEQLVYGQVQTGGTDQRLERLSKMLSASALPPLSPSQAAAKSPESAGPPQQSQAAVPPQSRQAYQPPVQKDATDYPTVTQMEQKVLGKTYTTEDITQRLARLEKQVFKIEQTGALADRMDNLKLVILGDTGPAGGGQMVYDSYASRSPAQPAYQPPVYQPPHYPPQQPAYTQLPPRYNPAYANQPQYNTVPYGGTPQPYQQQAYQQYPAQPPQYSTQAAYSNDPYGNDPYAQQPSYGNASDGQAVTPDMLEAMSEIEKNSIGQTFPNEHFEDRLNRVETKIFGQTAPELSYDERMQRVIAVASAGGAPQTARAKAKSTMMNLLPIILTILPMILL